MSQGPIQIAEPGAGFQMSPFGIMPLGVSVAPAEEFSPAAAPKRSEPAVLIPASPAAPPVTAIAAPAAVATQMPPAAHARPVGPRDVIRAARARVKEIRAELKTHSALKRELEELERLLKAAKQKPEPKLRALRAG